jgi:hypothetical protein
MCPYLIRIFVRICSAICDDDDDDDDEDDDEDEDEDEDDDDNDDDDYDEDDDDDNDFHKMLRIFPRMCSADLSTYVPAI